MRSLPGLTGWSFAIDYGPVKVATDSTAILTTPNEKGPGVSAGAFVVCSPEGLSDPG